MILDEEDGLECEVHVDGMLLKCHCLCMFLCTVVRKRHGRRRIGLGLGQMYK